MTFVTFIVAVISIIVLFIIFLNLIELFRKQPSIGLLVAAVVFVLALAKAFNLF